jgi:hypothetical protein
LHGLITLRPHDTAGIDKLKAAFASAFAVAWLLIALIGLPATGSENIVVGVNVVNPQWLRAEDRETVLNQLRAASVRVIRVPLTPTREDGDYRPAIDFIRGAYERGIKAVLIVGLQYREGAQRRQMVSGFPKMWPSYPLSSADPMRFRVVFEPLFTQLEDLGITFAALELGNEINWTAFNGDFPVPGQGRVFSGEDLANDAEARQITDGYRTYLLVLRVLKDIRDHSQLNRSTPILSAGLADLGPAGSRPGLKTDAVALNATIDYLRANGLDELVDAYAVHTYPLAEVSSSARRNRLARDTLDECRSDGEGKPCWLTEWGLPATATCLENDSRRADLMQELVNAFRPFAHARRLKGLLYYAWADETYEIFRCGALTEGAHLALDPKQLE